MLIQPRYILVNQCEEPIAVRQSNIDFSQLVIMPGKRHAFHWAVANMAKTVQMTLETRKFPWSKAIDIDGHQETTFYVENKDSTRIFSVSVRIQDPSLFIIFNSETKKKRNFHYRLKNTT